MRHCDMFLPPLHSPSTKHEKHTHWGVFLIFSKYSPPLNSKNATKYCILALSPFPTHRIQETPPQGCVSCVWHPYHPYPPSEHKQRALEHAVHVYSLHSRAPEYEKHTTIGT